MKKLLLVLGVSVSSLVSYSQIIFRVDAPASIAGVYGHTNNGDGSSWGLANLNDPNSAVLDTVVLADDGTPGVNAQGNPASATGCNTLPAGSLAGKIAMVFRGDGGNPAIGACSFGVKVLNCQNAGALAVIIVNREETTFAMAGGNEGAQSTIPVAMVTLSTGKAILDQIKAGKDVVAFLGKVVYNNNVTMPVNNQLRPSFGSIQKNILSDAAYGKTKLGSWIYNTGKLDQNTVVLNATVKNGTSTLYDKSANVALVSGDSAFVFLPELDMTAYALGKYDLTYKVGINSVDSGTDEFASDNVITTSFFVTDSIFAQSRFDSTSAVKATNFYSFTGTTGGEFQACTPFKTKVGSKIIGDGVWFGGLATNAAKSLVGVELTMELNLWDDQFTDANDVTLQTLNPDQIVKYTYSANDQNKSIFFKFDAPYQFTDNQRYLVCIKSIDSDSTFFGFDENTRYSTNYDTINQLGPVLIVGNTGYTAGSASGFSPAIGIKTVNNVTALNEVSTVSSLAYPNPAVAALTINVNANGAAQLTVTDLAGKTVKNEKVTIANKMLATNVNDLNAGTYVFNLQFENGQTSQFKVVVAK